MCVCVCTICEFMQKVCYFIVVKKYYSITSSFVKGHTKNYFDSESNICYITTNASRHQLHSVTAQFLTTQLVVYYFINSIDG